MTIDLSFIFVTLELKPWHWSSNWFQTLLISTCMSKISFEGQDIEELSCLQRDTRKHTTEKHYLLFGNAGGKIKKKKQES